ncbi:prolipoprotein diacylglyceryl transferase [Buchnera aphidicola (Schlechtendalia chinensis)]|uniref:Phosphatidylglycerol--prolipoprotein diacylglyceryl transferase n=1 Tax=Buchnera aphidicola subsp. Schlechtendalia chinensis TaxID=118110 RepID=A0A172WDV0_BUCSC|nr:prolipoprotein diacylglyceryl transferase [Buchnera aphidicola]ANF17153.1 prolipoprotein diacylglyceryl transferase [Buchnera aphidicola (Schlechtendalia chinensis)]
MNYTYILFPNFNPVIFSIFNISMSWYGFMYFLGFLFVLYRGKVFLSKIGLLYEEVESIIYFGFLGLFVGGRIGYIILYNPWFFLNNVSHIFKVWEGGMSFHGGLLGVILVIFYFSKKFNKNFFLISDLLVPLVPIGLGAGRLGNFINGELWGRVAPNFQFSFLYPTSKEIDLEMSKYDFQLKMLMSKFGALPRHPSQIYEFFLEGVVLFIALHYFSKKIKTVGVVSSIFLILYGILRIIAELFREPDYQLGFFFKFFTMGQILSIPMIIVGFIIIYKCYKKIIKN